MMEKINPDPYILLVNPYFQRKIGTNRPYVPYGLLYIATFLSSKGFKAKVYDADLIMEGRRYKEEDKILQEVRDILKNESPDIIGIGITTPQYKPAIKIAEISKELNKNVIVVVGGVHATFMSEDTAKEKFFDIIIRREGELTFLDLINCLINGSNLSNVMGITFVEDDKVVNTPDRPPIEDLDSIPFPDRSLLLNHKHYPHSEFGIILPNRGCPNSCSYCSSKAYWLRHRTRSAKNIVDEIEFLKNKYNLFDFWLEADSFLINKNHVRELCHEIKSRRLNIMWGAMARIDEFDKDIIKKLKSSGFCNVSLGIESGSQEILDSIGKKITIKQIKKTVKTLKSEGIFVNTYWMIGFPNETIKTLNETKNFIKELKPNLARTFIMTPFPGCKEYEIAKKENRLLSCDWSDYHVENAYLLKRPGINNEIIEKEYYGEFMDLQKKQWINWLVYLIFHPNLFIKKIFEILYQYKNN